MAVSVLIQPGVESRVIAKKLNLPVVDCGRPGYLLLFEDNQWIIKNSQLGPRFKILFEPQQELKRLKSQKLNPRKDLLCRALGVAEKPEWVVLDGTLGFAKDALHLLACCRKVIGIERNPLVFHLLKSGLEKLETPLSAFEIFEGETAQVMEELVSQCQVLYLDPMFEATRSKSSPKKNMLFLRDTVNPEVDVEKLVQKAVKIGFKRVVVKRAIEAQALAGKPQQVYKGKLIRFDVYQ